MQGKTRRVWSLNRTIVGIIIIGYAAFLGVLFIANGYLIATYQREIQNQNRQIMDEVIKTAENDLKQINDDIYTVYSNNVNFKKLLSDKGELEQFSDVYEIYNELRNKAVLNSSMDGFLIFYNNLSECRYYLPTIHTGSLYSSAQVENLYTKVKALVQAGNANRVWWTVIGHGDGASIAVICKKNNAAVCGIYNMDKVKRLLDERLEKSFQLCLLDEQNIYSGAETAEFLNLQKDIHLEETKVQIEKNKSKIVGQVIGDTGLWVCMIQNKGWRDYFAEPQILLLLLTGLSFIVVISVLKFIRNQYVKPIVELTEVMSSIREGNWDFQHQSDNSCKEINDINETFGSMLQEIKNQKIQVYEEMIEKQKAEMQYLQLQLKPHFFLNCLKTLNVMAIQSGSIKEQNFIMNISKYLRYLLQNEKELVDVQAELGFVKNYVEMQQNMTGRYVEAEYSMDAGIEESFIPVLCIQTFVENSVKHAKLASVRMKLRIKVEIRRLSTADENFLDIIVRDNGEGYLKEVLDAINGEVKIGNENIGINNLKRRCKLLYKGDEAFVFENQDGAYSELIIPERGRKHEYTDC